MKILTQSLAVAVFVTLAGGVSAGTLDEPTRQLQCQNEGLAAQSVMLMRQAGDDRDTIRRNSIPVDGFDLGPVIDAAMAEPKAESSPGRLRAGEKFKNRYKVACLMRTAK